MIKHIPSGFKFLKKKKISNYPELILISLGTRYKYYGFVIYAVGLYTIKVPSSLTELINSNDIKMLSIKFYRDLNNKQIKEALFEELGKRNYNDKTKIKNVENIIEKIGNMKYRDELIIIINDKKLLIEKNRDLIYEVKESELTKLLLDIYLDPNSVTMDLREGI